jgi:hypothetical protein
MSKKCKEQQRMKSWKEKQIDSEGEKLKEGKK